MLLGSMFWQLDVSILVLRIFGLKRTLFVRAFLAVGVGVVFLALRILSGLALDLSADTHVFGILMGKLGLAEHWGLEQGEILSPSSFLLVCLCLKLYILSLPTPLTNYIGDFVGVCVCVCGKSHCYLMHVTIQEKNLSR